MDINDIFKPTPLDLVSDINTQLGKASVNYYSTTLKKPSLPTVSSLGLVNTWPTLYWFEIASLGSYCNATLVEEFYKYRDANKTLKAITDVNYPMPVSLSGSKCLYVGKVRKGINERLNVHLGTGGSEQTVGLRLNDWLPEDVELTLHIYQIKNLSDAFLVDILEEYLRRLHEPILGVK